jgi:hypothetical protein
MNPGKEASPQSSGIDSKSKKSHHDAEEPSESCPLVPLFQNVSIQNRSSSSQ